MRVAEQLIDEETVAVSYPWDRGDPLHMNTHIQTWFTRRVAVSFLQTHSSRQTINYSELGKDWLDIGLTNILVVYLFTQ